MNRSIWCISLLLLCFVTIKAVAEMHGALDFALSDVEQRELKQSIVVLWSAETFEPCGGALVDDSTVITAAHCRPNASSWILVFDDEKKYDAYDPYEIANYSIHPRFSYSVKNAFDIAVIKLKKPVPNFKKVVFLPKEIGISGAELQKLPDVVAIGRHPNLGAGVYLELAIQNPKFSDEEFSLRQSESKGVCNGDSGSPSLVKTNKSWALIGILSHFDSPDGSSTKCGEASVYSNIIELQDWIQGIDWSKPMPPASGFSIKMESTK